MTNMHMRQGNNDMETLKTNSEVDLILFEHNTKTNILLTIHFLFLNQNYYVE